MVKRKQTAKQLANLEKSKLNKISKEEARKIQLAGGIARGKQKTEEKSLKQKYSIVLDILKDKFRKDVTDPDLLKILNESDVLMLEEMKILFDKTTRKETKLIVIEKIQDRMFGKVPAKVGMDPDNPFPEVPQTLILQVQPFIKQKK